MAFQDLEWKQLIRLAHARENPQNSPYKTDRSMISMSRNRYLTVQPWNASRIKLQPPIGGSDYINASPILLKSYGESSADISPAETRYIATQGPKAGQGSHFWRMLHQETVGDVGVVIMLTQLREDNREKCSLYYPQDFDDSVMKLPTCPSDDDGNNQQNHGELDLMFSNG